MLSPRSRNKDWFVISRLAVLWLISGVCFTAHAGENTTTPQTASSESVHERYTAVTGKRQKALDKCVAERLSQIKVCPVAPPPAEPPPLPFHTTEGYGGGGITPMAYLVNPGPKDQIFGAPSFAVTAAWMRDKNLQAITMSETLFGRLELSYGLDRFCIGSLHEDIRTATKVELDRDTVYLNNFNLRALLVEENSCDLPLPAITAGVHYKVNEGISSINNQLNGALTSIGYDSSSGVDYTLVATKCFKQCWTFNRPLMLTAGLRNSAAAQLGFLGFGDERKTTFEGNVVYMPLDNLVLGYEFRGKSNPYGQIPGLVGDEGNWQTIDVCWVINHCSTLTAGLGIFGTLCNTKDNNALFFQYKYEF